MEPYRTTLATLFRRSNFGIKLGLQPMRQLLDALDAPDRHMRHIVVAGTNGKGSTSKLIADALSRAGHRVGHFTSPHLLRFTERIRVANREIDKAQVVSLYERLLTAEARCERPATFFELTLAMALCAFSAAEVELSVLEVGMGGRLDATNVVDKTLSVITPIALDHQQHLGSSIAQIAAEKGGIIAKQRPLVLAPQPQEAQDVLMRMAAECQAPVVEAPPVRVGSGVVHIDREGLAEPLRVAPWQKPAFLTENLATAYAACSALEGAGIRCAPVHLADAASMLAWPARYQWLHNPIDTLIDGAHNPAAIAALAAAIDTDERTHDRPLHLVGTVLTDRPATLLLPLAERAASVHLAPVKSRRSRPADELRQLYPGATAHANSAAALLAASDEAVADGGYVLVAGSLFLAADALALRTGAARDPAVDG